MGIDITSKVIVGYTYAEICDYLAEKYEEDSEEYEQAMDDLFEELDRLNPWYDAGRDDCVWGVAIAYERYGPAEVTEEHINTYKTIKPALTNKYGIEPKLYAGSHVW